MWIVRFCLVQIISEVEWCSYPTDSDLAGHQRGLVSNSIRLRQIVLESHKGVGLRGEYVSHGGDLETDENWVLDDVQLDRIESMHRGFLYQHLYAVGCLLNLMSVKHGLVAVERNEDIEIIADTGTSFVQVKTRKRPIRHSDIEATLIRFSDLRAKHTGASASPARFAIVSNAEPGSDLKKRLVSSRWPNDVVFSSPRHHGNVHALAPPPWPSLGEAFHWCVAAASQLAFQSLPPETLVWKLAARVQFAASGGDPDRRDHQFRRNELPGLFEFVVQQLQEFPSIPNDYRPQPGEPGFSMGHRVQLITGFSGAGKTIWSAWQAQHTTCEVAYFDVGDLAGSALASSVARELAARFLSGKGTGAAQIPARAGIDALRHVSHAIDLPEPPIVVVDNIHRVDPQHTRELVEACPTVRFVLIGQPRPQQRLLESLLELTAEELPGWDDDTVAAVFAANRATISPTAARGWRQITSGLPLYVRNAAQLCEKLYQGDAARFLSTVQQDEHSVDLSQEAVLKLVIRHLTPRERAVLAALSLTNLKLSKSEVCSLIAALPNAPKKNTSTLRTLNRKGLVQVFSDGARKLHDALHLPARGLLDEFTEPEQLALKCRLRDLLFAALRTERDITRLGAWLRLLAPTGRVDILVDMASSEMFHELGDPADLKGVLINAANNAGGDIQLEFWALDSVVFWELQEDHHVSNLKPFLTRLENLVEKEGFDARQRATVVMKRMVVAGMRLDRVTVDRTFAHASRLCENDPQMLRIAKYNYATALFRGNYVQEAFHISKKLYEEYFDLLELDVSDVIGASLIQMSALFPKNGLRGKQDDIKHLADCLDLVARCRRALGQHPQFAGIHAVKFYQLSDSYRSQMRAAQDVADDFIGMGDPAYALEIMESCVKPLLKHLQFDAHMVDVRGQYAVILAYNGRYKDAFAELEAIEPYLPYLSPDGQEAVKRQRIIVKNVAATRPGLIRP